MVCWPIFLTTYEFSSDSGVCFMCDSLHKQKESPNYMTYQSVNYILFGLSLYISFDNVLNSADSGVYLKRTGLNKL